MNPSSLRLDKSVSASIMSPSIPAKPLVQAKLKCGGFFVSAPSGGFGKAHQLFGEQLPKLLDELNEVLAA